MIKTPERRHLRRSVTFIVNSVHISYRVLVFNFDHGCFPRFLKLYKCYQIAQNIYALFNICGSWNSPSHLFIEMFCYKSVIGKNMLDPAAMSCEKVFLQTPQNSKGNNCRYLFSDEAAGLRLRHRYFPVNFAKDSRMPFLIEHVRWLFLWTLEIFYIYVPWSFLLSRRYWLQYFL